MNIDQITDEELELLNSKEGLRAMFRSKKLNVGKALEEAKNTTTLRQQQEELIKLQNWVIDNNQRVVILFEGRDAAGKGGAIRRITEYINPRHFKIVALDKPTEGERNQWFFQRYINELPEPGQIAFFDRSWYNRAVVEPVNGFCSEKDYRIFMAQVNEFEKMLIESELYLIKLYFSISKDEQAKRFDEIKNSPLKRWKMTPVDAKAQALWNEYSSYKETMFEKTSTVHAPWTIIDANHKFSARLNAIDHILKTVPYK
jgi:polyphosphate kinase 2